MTKRINSLKGSFLIIGHSFESSVYGKVFEVITDFPANDKKCPSMWNHSIIVIISVISDPPLFIVSDNAILPLEKLKELKLEGKEVEIDNKFITVKH